MELARADGDAPDESVVPAGPDRKTNRDRNYEKAVLLAGSTAWSWLRLTGMHQVDLWFPVGQDRNINRKSKTEKTVLLAGRPRLMGMHQVNLWFRWGRTEQ